MARSPEERSPRQRRLGNLLTDLGHVKVLLGGGLLAGLALAAFALSLLFRPDINVTAFFLHRQDRWLLLIGAGLLAATSVVRRERHAPLTVGPWLPWLVAAAMLLLCYAGHYWVLSGYDMSIDEKLATFDADVFAGGHLVQTLPAFWHDHAQPLNTRFMYPVDHRSAWISSYLPLNAALRALIGIIASPTLTGPLMTVVGALALWGCARRIWPEDREAPVVALLLYAGSGQIVVTGMTAFAMPAHLACNLLWLLLFLRRAWWADMMAIVVGFVAIGLHQPLMHPMFAGPILLLLLVERNWPRAVFFGVGYLAIGMFWLWWPNWIFSLLQAGLTTPAPAGVDYLTRLTTTMLDRDPMSLPDIAANLMRFVAWQNLLLVPLMLLAYQTARKDRLAGALTLGVAVTILVMAVILPYQGFGFGYRYLHGLIGNCILLAVYGWKSLGARRSEWRTPLLIASTASILIILPLQLWMSHQFYAPAARVDRQIASITADYAIVGKDDAPFADDLVHNSPSLDTRPVRLIAEEMDPSLIRSLCRMRPHVALIGDRTFDGMNSYYGVRSGDPATRQNAIIAPRLTAAGCRVRVFR